MRKCCTITNSDINIHHHLIHLQHNLRDERRVGLCRKPVLLNYWRRSTATTACS